MNRPSNCQARPQSDQMYCRRCGLVWDTNDPEPPACRNKTPAKLKPPKPRKKEAEDASR